MQVWGDKTLIIGSYKSVLGTVRKKHTPKNFDVLLGFKAHIHEYLVYGPYILINYNDNISCI